MLQPYNFEPRHRQSGEAEDSDSSSVSGGEFVEDLVDERTGTNVLCLCGCRQSMLTRTDVD